MTKLLKIITALLLAVTLAMSASLFAFAEESGSEAPVTETEGAADAGFEDEGEIEIEDNDWGSIDEELTESCPSVIVEEPAPEVKPTEVPATPVPEVKPTEAPATPVPEVNETEVPVVSDPEVTDVEEKEEEEITEEKIPTEVPVEEEQDKDVYYMITPKEYKEYFFGDTIVLAPRADGAYMNEALTWQRRERGNDSARWENVGKFPSYVITITREALAFEYRFVTEDGAASEVFVIDATGKVEEEVKVAEEVNDIESEIENEVTADAGEEQTVEEVEQIEEYTEEPIEDDNGTLPEEIPETVVANTVEELSENAEVANEDANVEYEMKDTETEPKSAEKETEQIDITNMRLVQVKAAKGEKNVNLYAKPDIDSGVTMSIANGTSVYLQQFNATWSLVVLNNTRYYMMNSNIIVFGNDDNAITKEEQETFHTVSIHSELAGMPIVVSGTPITMTANLTGFEEEEYTVQWYYSTDGIERIEIPGATDLQYTYNINRENVKYYWYIVVTTPDEEEQEA